VDLWRPGAFCAAIRSTRVGLIRFHKVFIFKVFDRMYELREKK
jgi:hypothetical protein